MYMCRRMARELSCQGLWHWRACTLLFRSSGLCRSLPSARLRRGLGGVGRSTVSRPPSACPCCRWNWPASGLLRSRGGGLLGATAPKLFAPPEPFGRFPEMRRDHSTTPRSKRLRTRSVTRAGSLRISPRSRCESRTAARCRSMPRRFVTLDVDLFFVPSHLTI